DAFPHHCSLLMLLCVLIMLVHLFLSSSSSQDLLSTKVAVWEGAQSVVLPCHYSGGLKGTVTVKWNRYDLIPNTVHRRQERDDLREQNPQFRGRTSLRRDATASGDFSITLREPQLPDSGFYICWITDETEEIKRSDIQLSVRGQLPYPNYIIIPLSFYSLSRASQTSLLQTPPPLLLGEPRVQLGPPTDTVPLLCPGWSSRHPPGGTYFKPLQREHPEKKF
uniref:Ig-like domain-containing protein n=1 Tax=Cyprinodon variegatus TaxID=28743 RepID=A0A3Q2D4F1_CYPVA